MVQITKERTGKFSRGDYSIINDKYCSPGIADIGVVRTYSHDADWLVISCPPCIITAYGDTFRVAASLMDPTLSEFPLTSPGSSGTIDLEYSTFLESRDKSCRNSEIFLLVPDLSRIDISGKIQ